MTGSEQRQGKRALNFKSFTRNTATQIIAAMSDAEAIFRFHVHGNKHVQRYATHKALGLALKGLCALHPMASLPSWASVAKWTEEDARLALAALDASGQSVATFAKSHKLPARRFTDWRKRVSA